ncbi:hypothetical protein C3D72_10780 [Cronobacter sakazakii]|nr:hypothetical protein C3D72_10780 [Cronobacter sakazakii]
MVWGSCIAKPMTAFADVTDTMTRRAAGDSHQPAPHEKGEAGAGDDDLRGKAARRQRPILTATRQVLIAILVMPIYHINDHNRQTLSLNRTK